MVGGLATAIHALTYLLLSAYTTLGLTSINLISFTIAFSVSWLGHYRWTFAALRTHKLTALLRFFTIATLGLSNNIALTLLFVEYFMWPKCIGVLPIIFITPALTFVASKYWAFR